MAVVAVADVAVEAPGGAAEAGPGDVADPLAIKVLKCVLFILFKRCKGICSLN